MRVLTCFCASGALLAAPAYGQRLASIPYYAVVSPVSAAPTPLFRFDSTKAIPKTYWLEGGVISGVAMGVLAIMLASDLSEGDTNAAGYAGAFLIGATVGFPVGALIGGQFPKH